MKKVFLLPLMLFSLVACGNNGAKAGDGSEKNPYSVKEFLAFVDKNVASWGESKIGNAEVCVKGVVESSSYKSNYKSYSGYLVSPDAAKPFQFYSVALASTITGDFSAKDAMKDYTMVVKGYPQLYEDKDGNLTYEIAYLSAAKSPTGAAFTPTILSLKK